MVSVKEVGRNLVSSFIGAQTDFLNANSEFLECLLIVVFSDDV